MKLLDLLFPSARTSYRRARVNEARSAAARSGAGEIDRALAALAAGEERFLLGTLADGRPVRMAPEQIGRHGMVWGASGAGKSYFIQLVMEGFASRGRRAQLIDPKGETVLIAALQAAAAYLRLAPHERDAFAARFRVIDVRDDRLTPMNLFALPIGMTPSLLATLRAAALADVSDHDYSDLMEYGVYLLFAVAIALQSGGVTSMFSRLFFLDGAFRARVVIPKLADRALVESVTHLDDILPAPTRAAVVRQFDKLLSSPSARIRFGMSPAMVRALTPTAPHAPDIVLANYGPSLLLAPNVAKAQAINHVVDVVTDAMVRTDSTPELDIVEEVGSIVRQSVVAQFLLDASRTLRWKNVSLVCCAQDPTNAIPRETLTALVLNSRWLAGFEGREDANLLLPFLPISKEDDADRRQAFLAAMAVLPPQHCCFVWKGLTPLMLRTRDVASPEKSGVSLDELLAIFNEDIAARSMVRIADAERLIAAWEQDLVRGEIPPQGSQGATNARAPLSTAEDLFAMLDGLRRPGGEE